MNKFGDAGAMFSLLVLIPPIALASPFFEGVKVEKDNFLKMVGGLENADSGFLITTKNKNKIYCLGSSGFRIDEQNRLLFIFEKNGVVSCVVDFDAVEIVSRTLPMRADRFGET